ncbi:MAG TPA: hypothetical protein VIU64_11800, partial [Polyangia bacterium]
MKARHQRFEGEPQRRGIERRVGDVGEENPAVTVEPPQPAHLAGAQRTGAIMEDLENFDGPGPG